MFNLSHNASAPWITAKKRLYVIYVNPPAKQPQGTILHIHTHRSLFFKTRDYAKGYLHAEMEGKGTVQRGTWLTLHFNPKCKRSFGVSMKSSSLLSCCVHLQSHFTFWSAVQLLNHSHMTTGCGWGGGSVSTMESVTALQRDRIKAVYTVSPLSGGEELHCKPLM